MPVSWTPENERKFLLKIIHLVSSKDINAEEIATCFPGATPRAITEHLYVLRKEAKAVFSVEACGMPAKAGVKDEKKEGVKSEEMKGGGEVKKGRKRKAGGDVEGAGVGVGEGVEGGDVKKKKKKSGKGKRGGQETEGNGEKGDGEVA